MRLFAVWFCVAPALALASATDVKPAAPVTGFTLWETVSRSERYGPRDRTPTKVDTQTFRRCLAPRQVSADELMNNEDMMRRLRGNCWISSQRGDADLRQVKWACNSGVTAEIVTRQPAPNRLGYMLVFNIPNEGAVSITAESMQIADSCDPAKYPAPAAPPAPPPAPSRPEK
jgi:hypothetical protein